MYIIKHLTTATCLVFSLAVCAEPNTLDTQGSGGNTVNTDQSASTGGSLIDIYQVGVGSDAARNLAGTTSAKITQTGSGNTARIGQGARKNSSLSDDGVWNGGGTWTETGPVESNEAVIQQSGSGQRAEVYQTGDNNRATIIQTGGVAQAALIASQAGSAANTLTATQTISGYGGLIANIEQNGGGTVNLNQTGESSLIKVTNQTGGVANLTQQGSGNNMAVSDQSAHTVTLIQQDNNRSVTVNNPASDVTITQTPGH